MTKLLATLMLALPLAAGTAFAQDKKAEPKKEMTAQQGKMAGCNKEAEGKKGDERKKFMKECLSKEKDKKKAQQEKMKTCNKDAGAKKLKGDDRKKFMSECLSK